MNYTWWKLLHIQADGDDNNNYYYHNNLNVNLEYNTCIFICVYKGNRLDYPWFCIWAFVASHAQRFFIQTQTFVSARLQKKGTAKGSKERGWRIAISPELLPLIQPLHSHTNTHTCTRTYVIMIIFYFSSTLFLINVRWKTDIVVNTRYNDSIERQSESGLGIMAFIICIMTKQCSKGMHYMSATWSRSQV